MQTSSNFVIARKHKITGELSCYTFHSQQLLFGDELEQMNCLSEAIYNIDDKYEHHWNEHHPYNIYYVNA